MNTLISEMGKKRKGICQAVSRLSGERCSNNTAVFNYYYFFFLKVHLFHKSVLRQDMKDLTSCPPSFHHLWEPHGVSPRAAVSSEEPAALLSAH